MTALEKIVSLADGTTDESMHVCVPVSLIRQLQACVPAGVDPQSLSDEPEHVQRAGMDALIREAAVEMAESHLSWCTNDVMVNDQVQGYDTRRLWPENTIAKRREVNRALRILRHFGLIVEHGNGIVSIKEPGNV